LPWEVILASGLALPSAEEAPPVNQMISRLVPVATMLGVTTAVAMLMVAIDSMLGMLPSFASIADGSSWVIADLVHVPQFLIPFVAIWFITKGRLGQYGFNLRQLPPFFTHRRMFGVGLVFGLLMSLRYIPPLMEGVPVDVPQPVTLASIVGNMTFQWIVVGVAEETMFRGLIQTYLMNKLSGHMTILGHEMHIGTVIGAGLWGLFHFINVLVMPVASVVFFVALTSVAGLLMGYAYEKTGSLLTTIIVHNTIFGVPLAVGYLLYWLL
jgi:membrane protease YdiL (CAAX protease family)